MLARLASAGHVKCPCLRSLGVYMLITESSAASLPRDAPDNAVQAQSTTGIEGRRTYAVGWRLPVWMHALRPQAAQ